MSTIAEPDVVTTAQEWYAVLGGGEGGSVLVTEENVDVILGFCYEPSPTETTCEILFAPPDSFAAIFAPTFTENTGSGLIVTGLGFAGDAR